MSTRKTQILEKISRAKAPISATTLATTFGVSRQVIVGDVALLRAVGHDIMATARGYVMNTNDAFGYIGKIVSCHGSDDTKDELYTIVDLGATVVNVIVEHDIYGEITGSLNLKTRADVDDFMGRLKSSQDKLLLELSDRGVHMHSIACRDKGHYEQVIEALEAKGLLLGNGA
ncbi:MAG: transcription repressor NadR [Defluviitaleaceae bacterium]|nr:transcription repressor NadR [Defluviitaleaceae bacterium]